MQNEYPTHTSHCTMLLSGTGENEDKALLKASKYDTNDGRLKGDELLLSDSEQVRKKISGVKLIFKNSLPPLSEFGGENNRISMIMHLISAFNETRKFNSQTRKIKRCYCFHFRR